MRRRPSMNLEAGLYKTPDLGLAACRTVRSTFLLLISLWYFCYSSPNRLRHFLTLMSGMRDPCPVPVQSLDELSGQRGDSQVDEGWGAALFHTPRVRDGPIGGKKFFFRLHSLNVQKCL